MPPGVTVNTYILEVGLSFPGNPSFGSRYRVFTTWSTLPPAYLSAPALVVGSLLYILFQTGLTPVW